MESRESFRDQACCHFVFGCGCDAPRSPFSGLKYRSAISFFGWQAQYIPQKPSVLSVRALISLMLFDVNVIIIAIACPRKALSAFNETRDGFGLSPRPAGLFGQTASDRRPQSSPHFFLKKTFLIFL